MKIHEDTDNCLILPGSSCWGHFLQSNSLSVSYLQCKVVTWNPLSPPCQGLGFLYIFVSPICCKLGRALTHPMWVDMMKHPCCAKDPSQCNAPNPCLGDSSPVRVVERHPSDCVSTRHFVLNLGWEHSTIDFR